MRKEACDQINKMFGLNIDVEYREDYREMSDELDVEDKKGEDNE